MSTLDVLTVKLEADIAVFQQQLDRARAQLSSFGTATAPAEQGLAKVGATAVKSTAGMNRLNGAFLNLARQATGTSPVVAQLSGALGAFAIASGPMIAILAGLAAVAGGYRLITRDAREAAKAAEEAGKKITDAWMSRQTQGDIDIINQQSSVGGELDLAARKLQRAKDQHENKAYLEKLQKNYDDLLLEYQRADTLLADRRVKRQEEEAERLKRANEKLAADYARTAEKAAEAWARVREEVDKTNKGFVDDKIGGGLRDTSTPMMARVTQHKDLSFTDRVLGELSSLALGVGDTVKGMIDPKMLVTGLATGMVSTAIGMLGPKLLDLGKSLLGFSSAAERASRQIIKSLDDMLVGLTGTDTERAFAALRSTILEQVDAAVGTIDGGRSRRDAMRMVTPLRNAQTFEEFQSILAGMGDLFKLLPNGLEIWNKLLQVSEATWEDLNDEVRSVTDSLRNIPSGFKINLATFNATAVAVGGTTGVGGSTGWQGSTSDHLTQRDPITLRIVPEGILTVVETAAVRKIRSGGTLAWEVG